MSSPPSDASGARGQSALLAVSVGCPAGIGPEVALRAAAELEAGVALLVGDPAWLERVAAGAGLAVEVVDAPAGARNVAKGRVAVWAGSRRLSRASTPGKPEAEDGAAQLAWVNQATDLVARGEAGALVTGPVSKKAIASSGAGAENFRGHTEHLAERLGAGKVTMAFASSRLRTALVTTHLPLAEVPGAVTAGAVCRATLHLAGLLSALGPVESPIAVASLNPHAGEGGLLGREEIEAIGPGIERARAELGRQGLAVEVAGPVGAESAFRLALEGRYAGVVAMYHDQATIACKLVGFGEAVNVTLGLPVVRTSVDHGTGYDIAGRGLADPRGMLEAMALAVRLARG